MSHLITRLSAMILAAVLWTSPSVATAEEEDLFNLSRQLLIGDHENRALAAEKILLRGGTDIIPTLVAFMRIGGEHVLIRETLSELAGEPINTCAGLPTWIRTNNWPARFGISIGASPRSVTWPYHFPCC